MTLFQKENADHFRYDMLSYHTYSGTPNPRIYLRYFHIVKETPKGFWIKEFPGETRWVSKTSKKRFAYPTKEQAMESFIRRKERQIKILEGQLEMTKAALSKVKENE